MHLLDGIIDSAFYANRMNWNDVQDLINPGRKNFTSSDKKYYNRLISFVKSEVRKLKKV